MVFGEEIEYGRQRDFDYCGKVEIDQVRPKEKSRNYLSSTSLRVMVRSPKRRRYKRPYQNARLGVLHLRSALTMIWAELR